MTRPEEKPIRRLISSCSFRTTPATSQGTCILLTLVKAPAGYLRLSDTVQTMTQDENSEEATHSVYCSVVTTPPDSFGLLTIRTLDLNNSQCALIMMNMISSGNFHQNQNTRGAFHKYLHINKLWKILVESLHAYEELGKHTQCLNQEDLIGFK